MFGEFNSTYPLRIFNGSLRPSTGGLGLPIMGMLGGRAVAAGDCAMLLLFDDEEVWQTL